MSISPTLIVPLLTNNQEQVRVRTLLDTGSGTNWIVESLLQRFTHTKKGYEMLEVATFNGIVRKKFQLVVVYYMDPKFNKLGI